MLGSSVRDQRDAQVTGVLQVTVVKCGSSAERQTPADAERAGPQRKCMRVDQQCRKCEQVRDARTK